MFDEETEHEIDNLAEEFMEAVRDERLVFHEGCAVVTAPTGAPPEYITVMVDGINDPNVYWRGVPGNLIIGDVVLVWHNPVSKRREIISASGAGAHSVFVHDHHDAATGGDDLNPETISPQTFLVGPAPCPYNTLAAAVAAVNAAGPPASGTEYVIQIQGGTYTEGAADITIPDYTHVKGKGEGSIIDMGSYGILMGDYSSLQDLVILTTGQNASKDAAVDVYADTAWFFHVRVILSPADVVKNQGFQFRGDSIVEAHHCIVETTAGGTNVRGFVMDGADAAVVLHDCIADDSTNFDDALWVDNHVSTIITEYCRFAGATNDVNIGAAATWQHIKCNYDANNSTILGTETPLRDGAIEIPSDAIRSHNSLFPDLGTTTLAQKLGDVYLGTSKDVYAWDDGGGLFTRAPNHWQTITDHFNAFAGYTWAAYAPFDGAPDTADVATYPSLLRLLNVDTAEDFYAYQACNATSLLTARVGKGADSMVGIRMQDSGNDNNDFIELRLIDSATPGLFAIQWSYQVGGGGITTATLVDELPPMFYALQIYKVGAGSAYVYYGVDTPTLIEIGNVALGWTPGRAGVRFAQWTVYSVSRAGFVDWIRIDSP